eukprot:m.257749 g.257749  ORF g.257749 m.257749 type:complete len:117 (-) comp15534_c3_seq2:2722-3072(-)
MARGKVNKGAKGGKAGGKGNSRVGAKAATKGKVKSKPKGKLTGNPGKRGKRYKEHALALCAKIDKDLVKITSAQAAKKAKAKEHQQKHAEMMQLRGMQRAETADKLESALDQLSAL